MHKEFIILWRKKIRTSCGQNLTFKCLQNMIETSADRLPYIMISAFVLAHEDTVKMSSWKRLNEAFFSHYREDILNYFGYVIETEPPDKIKVLDVDILISGCTKVKREGAVDCSYKTLSEKIKLIFDLANQASTIERKMKEW